MIEHQVKQFENIRPMYETFAVILDKILKDSVRSEGINAIVQTRAKGLANFVEKLIRKKELYSDPVNQFTDLCGARVIVTNLNEIPMVCDIIRSVFTVDEPRSEDVVERLGDSRFGYRSVHFIISLDPETKKNLLLPICEDLGLANACATLEKLCSVRSVTEAAKEGCDPGPVFYAEIQVRTLIQHAWAEFAHDQIYKSDFDVPLVLKRDANRIAAMLEASDEAFSKASDAVMEYKTYKGTYLTPKELETEYHTLDIIRKYDPENKSLIAQMGRLAVIMEQWDKAIAVLKPCINDIDSKSVSDLSERTIDRLSAGILLDYAWAMFKTGKSDESRKLLEKALQFSPNSSDIHIALAKTAMATDVEQALLSYETAYKLKQDSPSALAGLILCKATLSGNLDFLDLITPSLEAGLKTCRRRADVGVFLPDAWFYSGLFYLLLGNREKSLCAYSKAVDLSISSEPVKQAYDLVAAIHESAGHNLDKEKAQNIEMIRRYLLTALAVKSGKSADAFKALEKSAVRTYEKNTNPVIIMAGGCRSDEKEKMKQYRSAVDFAFDDFSCTLISGGTTAGISGLAGDIGGNSLLKIGYFPFADPGSCTQHPAFKIVATKGQGFSPLEAIQAWIDLIASGVDPSSVKVLGISGGEISACEYRIALSLGACVGLVNGSGRAASELISDPDWQNHARLLVLPHDRMTLRCFVQNPDTDHLLDETAIEKLAREAHNRYRTNHAVIKADPSLLPWEELDETLKKSNRHQISFIKTKLESAGLTVKKKNPSAVRLYRFSETQIEIMSELEHGRWNIERLCSGWRLGDRDVENKKTPYLVPWSQLNEKIKEYDRETVRDLPEKLKNIGYEITEL